MIESSTPATVDDELDIVPTGARMHQVSVPITEELTTVTIELNQPGQRLVTIDGMVLTDDTALDGTVEQLSDTWRTPDPAFRGGYLHSYGPSVQRTVELNARRLSKEGIEVGDGEVTVSAFARGFTDSSSWRVIVKSSASGLDELSPIPDPGFDEFAFGYRLVAAYETPTDGAPHPVDLDPARAADLTWVPQCPGAEGTKTGSRLDAEVGTVRIEHTPGSLACLETEGWRSPLLPEQFLPTTPTGATVALTANADAESAPLRIPAYEPVPFEDFAFTQAGSVPESTVPPDGESTLDGFLLQQTELATLDDLGSDGTVTIDVPAPTTEFSVTTEGVGRFWLEAADGQEGPLAPGGSSAATYARNDYWTSWTDQETTWPIVVETISGSSPEQVILRVEGYQGGTFELRVIGEFREGEQP